MGERLSSLFWFLVVLHHQAVTTHLQLALLARPAKSPRLEIENAQLVAKARVTRCLISVLFVIVYRAKSSAQPSLRHSESGARLERLQRLATMPAHGRSTMHARGEDTGAQTSDVTRTRLLGLGQSFHMGLEPVHHGHTFTLH